MSPPYSLPPGQGRGRGTPEAPPNRFEKNAVEPDPQPHEVWLTESDPEGPRPSVKTAFFPDDSQSIITRNTSPDIGFNASLNPYRGCEHGCAYCYARPYHEYLGFNAGIDFESKIMVKHRAASLLEKALSGKSWEPLPLACSGVTDCYQPVERRLEITRSCLEVMARYFQPVGMITKNHLITRDIDLLQRLASRQAAAVTLSITTLDAALAHRLEPRASSPQQRLEAVRALRDAGIPVSVNMAPLIPGLNDHEIPRLLEAAADHGAMAAAYTIVRLPHGVKDLFTHWLEDNVSGQKEKILARIRDIRGGDSLNDPRFSTRMTGVGPLADEIHTLFRVASRRYHLDGSLPTLSTASFTPPRGRQMELF